MLRGRRVAIAVMVLALVSAAPSSRAERAAASSGPFVAQVNFQSQLAPVPTGYVADYGLGYSASAGYGWVQPNTTTPVSMVGNGKDRNRVLDPRLDSVMVVQGTAPPQWIMAVPNGTYAVSVSVGDYHEQGKSRVVVNGTTAIAGFKSTAQQLFQRATVQVTVSNGFIVLDAAPPAGTAANSRWNYVDVQQVVGAGPHTFTSVDPAAGSDSVPVTTSVTLTTSASVDASTITDDTIELVDVTTGDPVQGYFNTDAAGGVINFTPANALTAFRVYSFETTVGLRGLDGVPFAELTLSFETDNQGIAQSGTSFNRVTFDAMQGPTVIQRGPDGRIYVANAVGEIRRYDIDATTGLPSGPPLVIDRYLDQSTITGLAFSGHNQHPDVWVSRGALCDACPITATGTVSELTGRKLTTARDVIVGLPRSYHDHMNNGIHFGPDHRLYIAQGAMTGYGAPDQYWGMRSETPLSASILVADVLHDARFQGTVDVDTNNGYDPTVLHAPVKVYAPGLRNVFDFTFHANGRLYAAVNESAGGNTPAGPGGAPPALTNLPAGPDMLDDVVGARYYGHPNPAQGHYTLMGGNPTGTPGSWVWPQYPVGTQPETGWKQPMINLGQHRSPDGITEYTSSQFNGALQGQLLLTEFSVGKDLLALKLNATGGGIAATTQIASGFDNPIGVATDPSGRIYVNEFGSQPYGSGGTITLLQPTPGVVVSPYKYVNFQSESATVPGGGYYRDYGEAFNTQSGYGWIHEADATPLSLVGNGVARTCTNDERLDTFVAMQYAGSSPAGVTTPGRWQIEVPAGTYDVTASVGDCAKTDSVDELAANGAVLIDQFHPTMTNPFATGTARLIVDDTTGDGHGFIVLDAAGGTNTKLDYVNIDSVQHVGTSPTGAPATATARLVASQAGSAHVVLSTPDDFLGVGPRLAFSTVANDETRPARPLYIQNHSTATFSVTHLAFSGTNAGDFAITSAPSVPFTIAPGAQQEIDIAFRPVSTAVEQFASFDVSTNDATQPTVSAVVAGADAVGFEGGREPKLRDIARVLGYTDAIPLRPGTTRLPASNDEIISPYWLASDPSQPVVLHPLAHYSARQKAPSLFTGWDTMAAPKTITQVYSFAGGTDPYGGANQQIEPPITGVNSFSPGTTPFGLVADNAYSDDFYNSGQRLHNVRFFVAKGPGGVVLAHTWIVAIDIGNQIPPKNFDYQDEVALMTNADPLLPGAPKPNTASLAPSFAVAHPGTVLDRNGNGTGFELVLPNTAGNQYDPSKISLDTTHGTLSLTSTAGTMTARANKQIDALASHFDATRGTFTITSHLVGPFSQLNLGHDHQALWWGVDQDNFLKLEVENDAGQPSIIVFQEQVTPTGGLSSRILAGPLTPAGLGTATDLALSIQCDPASGSCTFSYAIDGGAATAVGITAVPTFPMLWFSRDSVAGILVSNQASTTPFVGTFKSFAVTAP